MKRSWGVFLDRDGTLFHLVPYLRDISKARLYEGVPEALRRLREAGARLVVVTNQAGIARGLLSRGEVDRLNAFLKQSLARAGAHLDRIEVCPHHPDFTGPCDCRKPGPGMIERAAAALNVDLTESWMIGDHETDLRAGKAAGCRTALVLTGYGRTTLASTAARSADVTAGTLAAAVRKILDYRTPGRGLR